MGIFSSLTKKNIYPSGRTTGREQGIPAVVTTDGNDAIAVVGEVSSTAIVDAIEKLEGGYSTMLGKPAGGTFVTAYAAATQITCTGLPSLHPTLTDADIEKIVQINAAGTVVETYLREDYTMSVAGNVITVTGATFAATDTLVVYTNVALIASPNYAEDTLHTSGDIGTQMLSVRNDANTPLSTDGNYSPLTTDSKGSLFVSDVTARVHLANIATSVQIMDDWDETNRCAVNLVAGQVGVQAGSGAFSNSTLRVTLATDDPQLGSVGAASDVDGNIHGQLRYIGEALVSQLSVIGVDIDDTPDSLRAPVKIGSIAETADRAVDAGDATNVRSDLNGHIKIAGYDTTLGVLKTDEQAATPFHRTTVEHDETLTATAKYYYVIPFDTYKTGSFVSRFVMGAGSSAVVKVYATNDASENISSITIANWFDVSTAIIGAASLAAGAGATTDAVWYVAAQVPMEYYVIEVDYTDAADSTVSIKAKLGY